MTGHRMHFATVAALVAVLVLHGCKKNEETVILPPPPAAEAPPVAAPEPTSAAPPASEATTYTVKRGDTLARIAREVHGSADNWNAILEANADQITDPDEIVVGQVLKIPAKTESPGN